MKKNILLGVMCSFQVLVFAQKPQPLAGVEILPNEKINTYFTKNVKVNEQGNTPVAIYDIRIPVADNEDEAAMVADFLKQHMELLHFSNQDITNLKIKMTRNSHSGKNIILDQFINGVPVYNGRLSITINHQNEVTFIANAYKYGLNLLNPTPSIEAENALMAATNHLDFAAPGLLSNDLMVYQNNEGNYLVYRIVMKGDELIGEWEVLVNAVDGSLVKVEDKAVYHKDDKDKTKKTPQNKGATNGTGAVFAPDPLSSSGQAYAGNYVDNNDASNSQLAAEVFTETLLDIDLTAGVYSLIGPYAENDDFENPFRGDFTQASSAFSFNRSDAGFEAVNTYYHIDRSMRYINDTLNIALMPYQYTGGVRFDPHGVNGADNSYFSSSTGSLSFGEGGVDDAEDADVILHELGHGLHDWLTVGGLSQVDGLSEGSGDYWAQSYSRNYGQWASTDAAYQWVFSWDGHNSFWNGRVTNYGASYPGGLTGSIHTDGQIWSTCLMKIWDVIGRVNTDMAFLEGLAMTTSTSDQNDAATAFQQAAINMNYNASHLITINTILGSCGYTVPDLPPLQVELLTFKGKRESATIVLNWESVIAESLNGYEIQRTVKDQFETIGFVEVSDKTSSYHFTDLYAPDETVYYRLKAIGEKRHNDYSKQIVIQPISHKVDVYVYPNPVSNVLKFELNEHDFSKLNSVVVRDVLGRNLTGYHHNAKYIDVSALEDGAYFIEFDFGTSHTIKRFVKTAQ